MQLLTEPLTQDLTKDQVYDLVLQNLENLIADLDAFQLNNSREVYS